MATAGAICPCGERQGDNACLRPTEGHAIDKELAIDEKGDVTQETAAGLLARSVAPDPAGFAWLDPDPWAAAPAETRLRALARTLAMVGGADYTPRLESLERLAARLSAGLERGATLGGCRVLPRPARRDDRRDGRLLVVREAKAAASRAVRPGEAFIWDGRFEVRLGGGAAPRGGLRLGPLGEDGWARAAAAEPALRDAALPGPARFALPALFDRHGLLESPHLDHLRSGELGPRLRLCRFAPPNALAPAGFTVA